MRNQSIQTGQIQDYLTIFMNEDGESLAQNKLQHQLNEFYNKSLSEPQNYRAAPDDLEELNHIRTIEDAWNLYEETRVKYLTMPKNCSEFMEWYQAVNQTHKQEVANFFNYLAQKATLAEIAYYIFLEEKVDGSFDDIIALAQLGARGQMKLIMAENYWDEMGHGNEREMHTKMFAVSATYMKKLLKDSPIINEPCTVAGLKNGNILLMYALRRKYVPRLLGAIGILEDTASERFSATVNGLKRYDLPHEVIEYHQAHIHIDSNHGEQWLKYVLQPLIETNDETLMQEIVKGVLIRFNIAKDYYRSIENKILHFRHSYHDTEIA